MCKQQKKSMMINILEILQKYTDENHTLNQSDIIRLLKNDYGMTAERKAVRRNIEYLIENGYEIEYDETVRNVPTIDKKSGKTVMKKVKAWSGYYLKRQFTDGELRLIIDSVAFSQNIPKSQCEDLIEKIEGLSSKYFHSRIANIVEFIDNRTDNKQVFLNIELLDEAIIKQHKVKFKYLEYGTDKKMHKKTRDDGTEREYVVSPYRMAVKEGKYFLICNYDKYNDISNYRIDRICDIEILDEPVKPFETLDGSNGRWLDTAEYMNERPYMYSSENTHAQIRIVRPMISDVIDMFGKDVRFYDEDESGVSVSVSANERAVEQFAKNFAPDVMILSPKSLRDKVKTDLEKSLKYYKD
ncbi:MAG: helix-turn-helix transcriptional regulator [Acutalibacteraceae bacterium]